jgi:peptide/nickel transport system substrate-binding protein
LARSQYRALLLSAAIVAVVAGGIFFIAAPRLSGPRTGDSATGATPVIARGGSLVASTRSEPGTLNTIVARDSTKDVIDRLVHARLVRINRITQEVEPWLAERWTTADGGLTYDLKLRSGVTFSDGAPFSADDVVFTFRAIYDEKTASPAGDAMRVGGKPIEVSKVDASSVRVKFPSAFAPGMRLLDNLPIVPRHKLEEALNAGKLREAWGVTTPPAEIVGLGPFVLSEYVAGQRLVFSRNERYWRTDERGTRLPYLDRLTVRIIPDQNTEVLQLQAGEVDFIQSNLRPDDYVAAKRLADQGRLKIADLGTATDADHFWFNLNAAAKAKDPRRAWLQATAFRHAVSHAIDRQAFANTVYLGAADPVHGPITPGNKDWYSPDLPTYPYDSQRARTLLAGLGLTDRNNDGMLEDAGGAAVRFALLTQKGHSIRERAAAVIQEQLRKLGIQMDVVTLEFGTVMEHWTKNDYDALLFGALQSDTDPALQPDLWFSSGGFHYWNPRQPQPATDWERRIDDLMTRQVAATDLAERKRLFREVQRIFAEQLPGLYFAAPRLYIATSRRVINATLAPIRPHVLWNADVLAAPGPAGT